MKYIGPAMVVKKIRFPSALVRVYARLSTNDTGMTYFETVNMNRFVRKVIQSPSEVMLPELK